MFCRQCGKQLPDGAKFCSGCGAKQLPYGAPKLPQAVPTGTPAPAPVEQKQIPQRAEKPLRARSYIKENLVGVLLNLSFCCVGAGFAGVALGIIGVVFGCKVRPACKKKDLDKARKAQKLAQLMMWLSMAALGLGALLVFVGLGCGWFKPIE